MNFLARLLQDIHYFNFNSVVKALGGIQSLDRSYALAKALGRLRTRFGYVGAGWSRERYLKTIKAVFPQISRTDAEALLKAYWVNHQQKFIELFLAQELTAQNVGQLVKFQGLEHLDIALQRGNGVILPVPHIGNERLHHIALALKGYSVAVISSKYEDHGSFARKIKIDASARIHEVGHPGDVPWLLRTLKSNQILQVASDAEADAGAVMIKFLGMDLLLPTGWVRLAMSTGAAIFPSALLRGLDNRHTLQIMPEFKLEQTGNKSMDLQNNVQRYMDTVSQFFYDRPDQIDWMSLSVRIEETKRSHHGSQTIPLRDR
ncbi:MAG: lysophospholipid acyltransferase family protein [bacterium]|nr:lysophospholipid acyltransferase family protein [bacterium]